MAQSPFQDDDLAKYFTNVKTILDEFANWIAFTQPAKRVLVIRGVGGVGKSSLLQMFRLRCRSKGIPVALSSGDEAKSVLEILFGVTEAAKNSGWAHDLQAEGVRLPTLMKSYKYYRSLEDRIRQQATNAAQAPGRGQAFTELVRSLGDTVGSAFGGTAIPLIGAPVGGAVGRALGNVGAEAYIDWLAKFLSGEEVDFIMQAGRRFATDFLRDLQQVGRVQRVVLLLDTYEQLSSPLGDWTQHLAKHLPENILLVIAGRKVPDWSEDWELWLSRVRIVNLDLMSLPDIHKLVWRYYSAVNDDQTPDPAQVGQIAEFARGLPLAVTSAVKLMILWEFSDFQRVKSHVVADLVNFLRRAAGAELLPALEAAGCVRWFNRGLLRSLLNREDVDALYEELRKFPFMRERTTDALMLHDVFREMMDEELATHDPDRRREFHERAAGYFARLAAQSDDAPIVSEGWQRTRLEYVFHQMRVNERSGLDLMQDLFEQGIRYFQYEYCANLLADAKVDLPISRHRIQHNQLRLKIARLSPKYVNDADFRVLLDNAHVDKGMRWQLYLDYGQWLGFAARNDAQVDYLRRSLEELRSIRKVRSGPGCNLLAIVSSTYTQEPSIREQLLQEALDIGREISVRAHVYEAYVQLGHLYLEVGDNVASQEAWQSATKIAEEAGNEALIADSYNRLAHALMGQQRLTEAGEVLQRAMRSAEQLPDTLGARRDKVMYIQRHMGTLAHMQGECATAVELYSDSADTYRERRSTNGLIRTLVLQAGCLYESDRQEDLDVLVPEIDKLAANIKGRTSKVGEVLAAWSTIQGHMLLDRIDADGVTQVVARKYSGAMITALGVQVAVMDEIVERILWKLSLARLQGHRAIAESMLTSTIDFWNTSQNGSSPAEQEKKQRQEFARFPKVAERGSAVARLAAAIEAGTVGNPAPWLSF